MVSQAGLTQLTRPLALMTLIKNLGRHSLPPLKGISSWDSTTRLEQSLPTWQGLQVRKIYPITLLDIENSDKTWDTWCITRCLNVVHEGVGDECVHEKLRADKFCLWCRDTSLPTSSEATRTPQRTEIWVAALLEFFFRPTSELLLLVATEDGGTTCSARNGTDERGGLAAGWPKTSRREVKG
jgi:hypothetical protein